MTAAGLIQNQGRLDQRMPLLNNCFSSAQQCRAEIGDTCKPFCVTVHISCTLLNILSLYPSLHPSFPSCLSVSGLPTPSSLLTILVDISRRPKALFQYPERGWSEFGILIDPLQEDSITSSFFLAQFYVILSLIQSNTLQ